MRIVFFGATELGSKCCRLIIEKKLADVTGIFTIPREFNISYSEEPVKNVNFADMHSLGKEFDIPVITVTEKIKEYHSKIESFKPDLIVVIGWYYMIPASIRKLAPLGAVGIHASLLPKYRGGAPLVWAIINGEKESGISLFYLDDGVDTGDVIAQAKLLIEDNDKIGTVIEKIIPLSLQMLEEYIPMIGSGTAPRIKQAEDEATIYPQRSPEDGVIDWEQSPEQIRNFIRAQSKPYPGAFTIINKKKVTLWDADIKKI